MFARLEAERRLKEAEESLARLEKAVVQQQSQSEQGADVTKEEQQAVQEEMITDVKTLKREVHHIWIQLVHCGQDGID